jgi:hypothetical protein
MLLDSSEMLSVGSLLYKEWVLLLSARFNEACLVLHHSWMDWIDQLRMLGSDFDAQDDTTSGFPISLSFELASVSIAEKRKKGLFDCKGNCEGIETPTSYRSELALSTKCLLPYSCLTFDVSQLTFTHCFLLLEKQALKSFRSPSMRIVTLKKATQYNPWPYTRKSLSLTDPYNGKSLPLI